ncbi:MAG TPA: rRNA cytosine-C5-methyltransferase [Bacteroidales bacterium]|jgi:16S rRNA (cytosine1407-C5)-methyltransferase|nr:rRNA cytosine-C5-methyltransferase [Bacteroidales bacterium]
MRLPLDFIGSMETYLGDEIRPFLVALEGEPVVSIRLNPVKTNPDAKFLVPTEPVPWSRWGHYLDERIPFTFDPLLHAGVYYVQEASSMFVEHVVRELLTEPMVCLDLCAAPGGKSLALLSALPAGSLLVANEVLRQRANVLAETLIKQGHPHVMVTNNSAADFGRLSHTFDLVLVDAPCSGEGMFRKDEMAVAEWSHDNVSRCGERQKSILNDVWPALKPGGFLLYSTCTFNVIENERVVLELARTTGARFIQVETEAGWGVAPSFDERTPGYRFFPHRSRGEGLSLFILQKPGGELQLREEQQYGEVLSSVRESSSAGSLPNVGDGELGIMCGHRRDGKRRYDMGNDVMGSGIAGRRISGKSYQKKDNKGQSCFLKEPSAFSPFLRYPDAFRFLQCGDRVFALPAEHAETMADLAERLKVVTMGIEIPSHALALSRELHPEAFPRVPVTYPQAIAYLRKEAIVLPTAPKGILLLTYEGEPIGFAKNVGNRANNLYPAAWRIRSSYLPEQVPRVIDLRS